LGDLERGKINWREALGHIRRQRYMLRGTCSEAPASVGEQYQARGGCTAAGDESRTQEEAN